MISVNPDLEKKLLSGFLQNKSFLDAQVTIVESDYFLVPEHQELFQKIKQYHISFQTTLSEEAYSQTLERHEGTNFEKTLSQIALFRELKSRVSDPGELRFVLGELADLRTRRSLSQLITNVSMNLNQGKRSEEILKLVNRGLSDIDQRHSSENITRRTMVETVVERKEQYNLKKSGVITPTCLLGFKELDDLTEGLQKEEIGVVIARSGVGKSRMLFNLGYNIALQGKHVMYTSIEMYCTQVERMFDSRAACISSYRLKKGKLDPAEEQRYFAFLEKQKTNPCTFYLVDIPTGCSVQMLEAELDRYESKHGHPVDVLIVDYLMLMHVNTHSSNLSVQYGDLTKQLKALARSRKISILTAAQTTRSSIQAPEVGTEHVSFSDGISWNSDLIVALGQSKTERLQNILSVTVVKYRDGRSNKTFKLFVDFDYSYIGDAPPSAYGGQRVSATPQVQPGVLPTTPPRPAGQF